MDDEKLLKAQILQDAVLELVDNDTVLREKQQSGPVVEPKSRYDIDAAKARSMYVISETAARLRIIKMAQDLHASYKIDSKTGKLVYCFNKRYLKKFEEGLIPRKKNAKETKNEYFDAIALSEKYIDASVLSINWDLKRIYNNVMIPAGEYWDEEAGKPIWHEARPCYDASEKLRNSIIEDGTILIRGENWPRYKLRGDEINEFCETVGAKRQEIKLKHGTKTLGDGKRDTYLDARELSKKYIDESATEINQALEEIWLDSGKWDWVMDENEKWSRVSRALKYSASKKLRKSMMVDGRMQIQGKKMKKYKLRKGAITDFCKVFGFQRITTDTNSNVKTTKKPKVQKLSSREHNFSQRTGHPLWKSEYDLPVYIYDRLEPGVLHELLFRFAKMYPLSIRLSDDGKSLAFNLALLVKFCKFAGLEPSPVPFKTDKWKNAQELKSEYHIDATLDDINRALDEFLNYKTFASNSVGVLMNTNIDKHELCVYYGDVTEFLRFAGFLGKKKGDKLKRGAVLVETLAEINTTKDKVKKPDGHGM